MKKPRSTSRSILLASVLALAGCDVRPPVDATTVTGSYNAADEKHGMWTYPRSSVSPSSKGEYVNGSMEGQWSFWDQAGVLIKQGEYERDEPHGRWIFYYDTGQMSSRGSYEGGKMNGPWEIWHANGNLRARGSYRDDRQDGEWQYWTEDGASDGTEIWVGGTLVSNSR